ncbi:DUF6125 family protein [Chloroflexota bacterium]
MTELDARQLAEFHHRSYSAVDGLWFLKVEEKYGFDVALEINTEVWKVMPKIQARKLKSTLNKENGIEALLECLTPKLISNGFTFRVEKDKQQSGFCIIIDRCPVHDLMVKSGRENLSEKIGNLTCNAEYSVWASEFGEDISFELQCRICKGSESCIFHFSH